MKYRSLIFCCIVYCIPLFAKAQHTEKFKKILLSEIEFKLKVKKIDSFFNANGKNIANKELADCYHEFGKWYYKSWKKHSDKVLLKNAIVYTNKAAVIKRKLPDVTPKSLKKTLYNLGFFHFKNHDFFSAIDCYIEITEIPNIDAKTIAGHRALGNAYAEIGDFHKALDHVDHMIRLTKKDTNYRETLIQGYLTRANIYSLIGYKEQSKNIKTDIEQVDSILKKSNLDPYKLEQYKVRKYHIEGNRLLETGEYKHAITVFSKVLKSIYPHDSISKALVYNSIGVSFLHLGKLEYAKQNLDSVVKYHSKYTPVYENLGDLYVSNNKFIEGLQEYQKAINYAISDYNTPKYNDLINKEDLELATQKYYLLHHLIQKGKAWIKYYHFDSNHNHLIEALKTFKLADKLVDIIRFESFEYRSKLYWREKASSLYMNAVEACFLLQKIEDAYYFMEKNKAILLLEDITNEHAKEYAGLPKKLASREYHLKQNIYLSENKLNTLSMASEDIVLTAKKSIYKHKRNYQTFVDSLDVLYPDYAISKQRIKVLPYTIFKHKYISDNEVVLQYIVNENRGYGILHTKDQRIFFEINDVVEILENIETLNLQVTTWFLNEKELIDYHRTARYIFNKLIPNDIYSQIRGKNITIIPDHALQQLSFETLITSEKKHSYLIKDTEIRYAYSMSYLHQNNQKDRNPKHNFFGVAPVEFDTKELGALIYSKNEVAVISEMLSGHVLLNEEGTKANVIDRLNQYRIIHLSTHADIRETGSPWIAFRDQKMSLKEIYTTKNQSDLIVLSACKTSLGKVNKGEGVMSLARGFFYAGTNSIISSLWSVNDKANQELMIDFYKNMNQGLTKSTALRKAKLNYINTHEGSDLSPFYWGALILIGDNATIDLSQELVKWYYTVPFMALILIVSFLLYIRQRNKKG